MGYFSNGTEGVMYQEKWCERCVHDIDHDCAVWTLQLLHNYNAVATPAHPIHTLIPRDGIGNGECRMFVEKDGGT